MSTLRTSKLAGLAVALAIVGAPLVASSAYAAGSPPASPSISAIVSHNRALTVSWTESSTGSITYKATATAPHRKNHSCTTKALKCTISSLVNGVQYSVSVVASNASGKSAPSAPMTATVGVPGAPLSVHATAGKGQASVRWAPPAASGVSAITGYTATASDGTNTFTCSTTGARSCTITGLTKGTTYSITAVASNKYGSGPASKAVKVTSK
jgi:hypothetical protein